MRLWHKARYGDGDLAVVFMRNLAVQVEHLVGQISNTCQVLVRFCRQAHHEIKLYCRPAVAESVFTGLHEVFFRNALVDDVAQTLGSCFRRQGQAALTDLLDLLGNVDGKAVNTQGWQADADLLVFKFFQELIDQFRQARIIC